MSYKLGIHTPLFRAHNTTKQTGVHNGSKFLLASFYGCVGDSYNVFFEKAFVYGETRTDGTAGENPNTDSAWAGGTILTSLSEGYQIRTNANYSVNMDDGIYGVIQNQAAIIIKSTASASSDVEETRIFGMRLA
jgi:hypothetical protein